jgi:outer membrane protein assembly factor BamB
VRIASPVGAKVALAGLVLLLAAPAPDRGEWRQWRGAERDGVVAWEAPAEWPAQLALRWDRDLGEGYSGPVVAGDRVWVHTRKDGAEVVSALTLGGGETVWSRRYAVPFEQDPDARQHGEGPYATPAVADGRLFTLSMTSILSAWDAESGTLLWRRDFAAEFDPPYPYFGAASSPLVWGDQCFVHFGSIGWDVGDRDSGAMIALDVVEGRERWRWAGDAGAIGASPMMHSIGGRLQLIFKTKENIVGLDPLDGEELWRIPYLVSQYNTIVTPLLIGNQLVTSDWDKGLHAWRIAYGDESWSANKLWESRAASMFTSSPVIIGGQVVGFSHFRGGQLFGLDPTRGEVLWTGIPRSGEHASLIAWGDWLLVFRDDGLLMVGQVSGDGFHPARTYRVGRSGLYAHPAVVGNLIIVKNGTRLAAFALSARPSSR